MWSRNAFNKHRHIFTRYCNKKRSAWRTDSARKTQEAAPPPNTHFFQLVFLFLGFIFSFIINIIKFWNKIFEFLFNFCFFHIYLFSICIFFLKNPRTRVSVVAPLLDASRNLGLKVRIRPGFQNVPRRRRKISAEHGCEWRRAFTRGQRFIKHIARAVRKRVWFPVIHPVQTNRLRESLTESGENPDR